jgi:hypothetical protein
MTTTYTFEQLKEDVRKEAKALRAHATEEERGRLKMSVFNPRTGGGCIYGLLSGYCHSDRAIELIQKCCVRFFRNNDLLSISSEGFSGIKKRVVAELIESLAKHRGDGSGQIMPEYYSAIETYILLPEARNANLIAYLRCETETLEL